MHKIYPSLLLFFFCLNFIQAQEVPQIQTSLVTKVTATWCPPCGTWGWDLFEEILEDNHDNAIVLAAHYSGDLQTFVASDIAANFNANSQPRFIVNNSDILANSSNADNKRVEVKSSIDEMVMESPQVNTGMMVTRANNEYTIQTKTTFFKEMTGKIHLSIIAIESDVVNFQASRGIVPHANVIRATVGSSSFGPVIAEGTISTGTEFEATYTMPIETSWDPENVEIVALLWNEVDGKFQYINGNKVAETEVSAVAEQTNSNFSAEWRSNGSSGQIYLNAVKRLNQANIQLYTIGGQLVNQIFTGSLNQGVHQFPIDFMEPNGHYLVKIQSEQGNQAIRIQ